MIIFYLIIIFYVIIFSVIIFSMLIRGEGVGLQPPVKDPVPIEILCMGVWAKNPSKQNNSIILGFDWLRETPQKFRQPSTDQKT